MFGVFDFEDPDTIAHNEKNYGTTHPHMYQLISDIKELGTLEDAYDVVEDTDGCPEVLLFDEDLKKNAY